jgi:hypothetical protein
MDDLCSAFSSTIVFIGVCYFGYHGIRLAIAAYDDKKAAQAKAEAERKEAEFQQNHPELWRQRELLKLEKERMATQQQLAEKKAKQEAVSRGVGTAIGLGRFLGWW